MYLTHKLRTFLLSYDEELTPLLYIGENFNFTLLLWFSAWLYSWNYLIFPWYQYPEKLKDQALEGGVGVGPDPA